MSPTASHNSGAAACHLASRVLYSDWLATRTLAGLAYASLPEVDRGLHHVLNITPKTPLYDALRHCIFVAMSEEKLIYDDFNERMRGYWTNNADYDRVNALLLHWEEDDLTVKPEVERFEALLKNDFHFKARIYPIPSENSGAQLNLELASFIKQNSLQKRSLTIVYYAGHADDVEENSPPGYSEWRA